MNLHVGITPPQFLYGIIGHPLGHSLSPRLHTWIMEQTGHPGAFYAWPVSPDELPEFMAALRTLPVHGLCVTIPHKTAVIPFLDELTPEAQAVGAANTLFWRDGKLFGHNTDVAGFLTPLREYYPAGPPVSALVLGAGGAARAVLHGLNLLGVKNIRLTARNKKSGLALAEHFGCEYIPWEQRADAKANLVINTTPLGMSGSAGQAASPLGTADFISLIPPDAGQCLAYDLVYNPLHTPFLRHAQAAGWSTQDGLCMLAAQGLAQFACWSGQTPPPLPEAVAILEPLLPG